MFEAIFLFIGIILGIVLKFVFKDVSVSRKGIGKYVVITTNKDCKGVFFGLLKNHNTKEETVILEEAQMCIYWNVETKGVLGLAHPGPQEGCKITPIIPEIYLNKVTSVMKCSKEAIKNWKKQPWS